MSFEIQGLQPGTSFGPAKKGGRKQTLICVGNSKWVKNQQSQYETINAIKSLISAIRAVHQDYSNTPRWLR